MVITGMYKNATPRYCVNFGAVSKSINDCAELRFYLMVTGTFAASC